MALDKAQLAIDQYERRLAALRRHPDADLQEIEQQVQTQTDQQRQQVHEEEAETHRYERLHEQEQAKPVLDASSQHTLQACYRDLCRRFHPDLAMGAEQRARCEEVMRRINAAAAGRQAVRTANLARPLGAAGRRGHLEFAPFCDTGV